MHAAFPIDVTNWPKTFKFVIVPLMFLLFYGSILLYVILLPFLLVYGFLLCVIAWAVWPKERKDVLLVHDDSEHSQLMMEQIAPLVERRALVLDYSERSHWPAWSLPVQIFHRYGPKPIPQRFIPNYLPAVILVKRFRFPKKFTFGGLSRNRDLQMDQLRSELAAAQPLP